MTSPGRPGEPRVASRDYRNLDASGAADDAIRHMDELRGDAFIADLKQRSYALLGLVEGTRVLDVGCGTGDDVIAMARIVGPGGTAAGVDLSAAMIAEATSRAAAAGVSAELRVAGAAALPFPDGAFDAVRAERVLQHVENPEAALSEMIRVAAPGGRVMVIDADRGVAAQDFAGWDADVASRLGQWAATAGPVRNGLFGRQARRLMIAARLRDVVAHPLVNTSTAEMERRPRIVETYHQLAVAAGVISAQEAEARTAAVMAALADGTMLTTTLFWLTVGTAP